MTRPDKAIAIAWLKLHGITYNARTRNSSAIGKKVRYVPFLGVTTIDGENYIRSHAGLCGLQEVLLELGYFLPVKATSLWVADLRGGRR